MKPLVIQTESLPQKCSDWLAERAELHVCPQDSLRFKELLPKATGLVIRTYTNVDRELLDRATNLQVVGRAGVGVDNINVQYCKEKNIAVVHTPNANTESVVEFVLTTMFDTLRNIHPVTSGVDQETWSALRGASMTQKEFTETTLGIIGFGKIGSRLGKLAKTLGFRVFFHDLLKKTNTYGCEQTPLHNVLSSSDIVSIHVDGRTENKHLCDKQFFSQMKNDALFINAARGFMVDAYALREHLARHKTARAILDVHDPEPITAGYPLLGTPNATLFPHVASKTKTASINMGWVVKDVVAVLSGQAPKFQVKT